MQATGLVLTAPRTVSLGAFELPPVESGYARVRVAGCGVCHTDISFYTGDVRTKHPLPLVLGHEIAGTVVDAPAPNGHLVGREVIVPAVIPCGTCDLCRSGHETACQQQMMPGNDGHGGFATEVVVPARFLVGVPAARRGYDLADLSVIADAVTTPYQALTRGGVDAGDLVVIVGAGGIGTYAVQIALAKGARVAVIDIDPAKLERLRPFKPEWLFNVKDTDGGAIKKQLRGAGVSTARWRIFEMSGTASGQELAWSLLVPAATLGVIGFTMDKPSVRLSNLMALDARAFGNWGCSPKLYGEVVDLVISGKIDLKPFIERHPIGRGPELLANIASHKDGSGRRAILVPE